jgi:hypothetical protein
MASTKIKFDNGKVVPIAEFEHGMAKELIETHGHFEQQITFFKDDEFLISLVLNGNMPKASEGVAALLADATEADAISYSSDTYMGNPDNAPMTRAQYDEIAPFQAYWEAGNVGGLLTEAITTTVVHRDGAAELHLTPYEWVGEGDDETIVWKKTQSVYDADGSRLQGEKVRALREAMRDGGPLTQMLAIVPPQEREIARTSALTAALTTIGQSGLCEMMAGSPDLIDPKLITNRDAPDGLTGLIVQLLRYTYGAPGPSAPTDIVDRSKGA